VLADVNPLAALDLAPQSLRKAEGVEVGCGSDLATPVRKERKDDPVKF
jgi:hypothetical protein